MTIEGLGKKFQEARIARGLTLDEAARLTKIRPSRLAEIEADDFSQFPSLAYAKGFLLIYGKFLDVDVTPYLDAFETSQQVTVDGYSYLQDQPAPKPRRVRTTRPPTVRRERRRRSDGDRSSPMPLLIGIGVIIVGFVLMRLILNIQRISPHQMVGVPQPTASAPAQQPQQQVPPAQAQAPAPQTAPPQRPVQTPAPSVAPVAQAPSRAPSQAPVAMVEATKKPAPPVSTPAPSIAIPDAFVPAFANAKSNANPNPTTKPSVAPTKEPEVRRAEPVKPEELAEAEAAQKPKETQTKQTTTESQGPNQIAIKPLKKTYIKVVVDNESQQPAFERWISPADGTVEFRGQKIAVRVLDRDAIQIRKNGKPVAGGDEDVTVE
jgi:cytoskeletal protein RodZ